MTLRAMSLCAVGFLLAAPPPTPANEICPAESELVHDPNPGSKDWACIETRGDGTRVREGWSVTHRPDGTLQSACEFSDDVEHGRCSYHAENGKLVSRGTYQHGQRAGYWWVWGMLELLPEPRADDDRARPRAFLANLLAALDVPDPDIAALVQYLLDVDWDQYHDIRTAPRFCARSACVSAGVDGTESILAIQYAPPIEAFVEADFEILDQRSIDEQKAEQRAAAKREAAYQKALTKYERDSARADGTRLVCMDGTRSPSCTCGGGWQGCCSHHGGVSHCPAEYPEPPLPPVD
jgi:hypothetical protein